MFVSHLTFYSFSAIRESCKAKGKVSEVVNSNFFFFFQEIAVMSYFILFLKTQSLFLRLFKSFFCSKRLIFVYLKYDLSLFRDFEAFLLVPTIKQERKAFDSHKCFQ